MKLSLPCGYCPGAAEPVRLAGEILDGGIVHARCPNGHAVTWVLHEPAFELTFEFAALALLDGYYREAVLGFTTALERLYAFAARVIAHRHGLPSEAFAETWKRVNRAERQLGAFLVLYALEMKRPCDLKPVDRFTELRNKAAHEGRIPTGEQAIEYGRAALDFIHGILAELRSEDMRRGMVDIFRAASEERAEKATAASGTGIVNLARSQTMVALKAPSEWRPGRFDERFEFLRKYRDEFYACEMLD